MSRVDALKEKIGNLHFHISECIRKSRTANEVGDELTASHFDMLVAAGEEELNNLYRDLADAMHDEAMASRRDYLRDQSYGRQA